MYLLLCDQVFYLGGDENKLYVYAYADQINVTKIWCMECDCMLQQKLYTTAK